MRGMSTGASLSWALPSCTDGSTSAWRLSNTSTSAGDRSGKRERTMAAAAATAGALMLVPDFSVEHHWPQPSPSSCDADRTAEPGAYMSTHRPQLLYHATVSPSRACSGRFSLSPGTCAVAAPELPPASMLWSKVRELAVSSPSTLRSSAPTVITPSVGPPSAPGELPHASAAKLPAATTTTAPASTARRTATSAGADRGPWSDMLMTFGRPLFACASAQSTPAMMTLHGDPPRRSKTFRGWHLARLAAPKTCPHIVPIVCEPCPCSSVASASLSSRFVPGCSDS